MKPTSLRPPIIPPRATAAKLFLVGSTIGPVVDSLHNQCLLAYDIAPITVSISSTAPPLFCSSWVVPPLLGIAYVVLGYIIPRVIELVLNWQSGTVDVVDGDGDGYDDKRIHDKELQNKAVCAVASTALIIKLSEVLQTHDTISWWGHPIMLDSKLNLILMAASDAAQWAILDRTPVAFLAAIIVAFGGPLAELPFVANGFWHYLPEAADYLPLSGDLIKAGSIADNSDLALSSITGPCYFAVTMDAIALSRYIYTSSDGR